QQGRATGIERPLGRGGQQDERHDLATLPAVRVDGQAAVFTVDQRRHREAQSELGHGDGAREDRDRRAGRRVDRPDAEARERDKRDRPGHEHELGADQHQNRAAPGHDCEGAHRKERRRGGQHQVEPDVHRPLGRAVVGAASSSPPPSAAQARITTRTASPTTYVYASVAPNPAPGLTGRTGQDVVARITTSKARTAAATAVPTIHSRLKGSWVDSSPVVRRNTPTSSAALTVVKTRSWTANNRKGAIVR